MEERQEKRKWKEEGKENVQEIGGGGDTKKRWLSK